MEARPTQCVTSKNTNVGCNYFPTLCGCRNVLFITLTWSQSFAFSLPLAHRILGMTNTLLLKSEVFGRRLSSSNYIYSEHCGIKGISLSL